MAVRLVPPKGLFIGWRIRLRYFGLPFLFHNFQCDRRWLFGVRIGKRRVFGYLTHGDATPDMMAYHKAGWWLFKKQGLSGLKV